MSFKYAYKQLIGKSQTYMTAQTKKSRNGKVGKSRWRTALWVFLWILVFLAVLLAWAWQSRYSLIEGQLRKRLAKQGISAALNIEKIGWEAARVDDIVLSSGGEVFFEAEQLQLQYAYKDALKGVFESIKIVQPAVTLHIDENGRITDEWLSMSSGTGNAAFELPSGGIEIEEARLDWDAPFGDGALLINAEITSNHEWALQFKGVDTVFTNGTARTALDYEGALKSESEDEITAIGTLFSPKIAFEGANLSNAKIDYNLKIVRTETSHGLFVTGWSMLDIKDAQTAELTAGPSQSRLDIDALFDMDTYGFKAVGAGWTIDAKDVSLVDAQKRRRIGDLISANKTLSQTPVTMHFTPFFSAKTNDLLELFSLSGEGRFSYARARGYDISLNAPLRINGKKQSVVVSNAVDAPALTYFNSGHTFSILTDIDWHGKRPLKIESLAVRGRSVNGLEMSTLNYMSAHIKSPETWSGASKGQALRLSPFEMDFEYKAGVRGAHQIKLNSNINYDGPVPGGFVKGLTIGGGLDVSTHGSDFTMAYAPVGAAKIQDFVSDTGWRAANIRMNFDEADTLFSRKSKNTAMLFSLEDVTANIISPEDDRHLASSFESMIIRADISSNPRQWDIDMEGAVIRSDDFPSPQTLITTDAGDLHVLQSANGSIEFSVSSPLTQIETENIRLKDTAVKLQGRPEDFTADYQAVSVEFLGGGDVPKLPLKGTARMQGAKITGEAISYLPQSKETPITIDFNSVDGRGTAKVTIDDLVFDPSGLQPQYLVPSLSGKLADVRGLVSAQFEIGFGGGGPINSSGNIKLKDMDVGTLVGPFTGVNTNLAFSSMFPLKSQGVQTTTMSGFDPGFPLQGGQIKFEIVENGVRIDEAVWPVENLEGPSGKIYIAPVDWRFGDVKNRAVIHIENIGLGTMLDGVGKDKLSATGQVYGVLPAVIDGVNVSIEQGKLGVRDGGIIKFKSSGTDAAAAANENAGYAFQALEDFQYKQLEALIDGPIDGDMTLKVVFEGHNPEVLNGQQFQFNNVFEGELMNITRNMSGTFSNEENLNRIMEIKNGDSDAP